MRFPFAKAAPDRVHSRRRRASPSCAIPSSTAIASALCVHTRFDHLRLSIAGVQHGGDAATKSWRVCHQHVPVLGQPPERRAERPPVGARRPVASTSTQTPGRHPLRAQRAAPFEHERVVTLGVNRHVVDLARRRQRWRSGRRRASSAAPPRSRGAPKSRHRSATAPSSTPAARALIVTSADAFDAPASCTVARSMRPLALRTARSRRRLLPVSSSRCAVPPRRAWLAGPQGTACTCRTPRSATPAPRTWRCHARALTRRSECSEERGRIVALVRPTLTKWRLRRERLGEPLLPVEPRARRGGSAVRASRVQRIGIVQGAGGACAQSSWPSQTALHSGQLREAKSQL